MHSRPWNTKCIFSLYVCICIGQIDSIDWVRGEGPSNLALLKLSVVAYRGLTVATLSVSREEVQLHVDAHSSASRVLGWGQGPPYIFECLSKFSVRVIQAILFMHSCIHASIHRAFHGIWNQSIHYYRETCCHGHGNVRGHCTRFSILRINK